MYSLDIEMAQKLPIAVSSDKTTVTLQLMFKKNKELYWKNAQMHVHEALK